MRIATAASYGGTIDLLREFSTACRQEFEDLQLRQL
jgi:hypothetical protein